MRWTLEVPITNGAEADGEDVRSRRLDAGVKFANGNFADDGGKQADLRGERAISRKPLRGDAGCFLATSL
jgi:hypothetical protein